MHLPQELQELYDYDMKNCQDLQISPNYINISDVIKAHYILADFFTDPSSPVASEKMLVGVRNYNLLGSAIGRQIVEFGGKVKYTERLDICATLFFGLTKNHAFHDGNKRTALLVLLYQLQKYGYYPQNKFREFEKLVLVVADNKIQSTYKSEWNKCKKNENPEIKTISKVLRKLTVRGDNSYHMNITTKDFCKNLEAAGVKVTLQGDKIKFERELKRSWFLGKREKYQYFVQFYGWTRSVKSKMARDIINNLHLNEEYPSFQSISDIDNNIYNIVNEFEGPLRKLKDE